MAEVGARPRVSPLRRRTLKALESFFTPLLPDDYLELINPLWTTRELRGRVEEIRRETEDAVTVLIRPGHDWPGHEAGQYVRIGFVIDGVHHWRAYSLTSDPADRFVSITPKLFEPGTVSPYLVRELQPGTIVRLGEVEGTFKLPEPRPERALFLSAGSGITPIRSMLRALEREGAINDVVHVHSAHTADDFIFGDEIRDIAARNDGMCLIERHTRSQGRISPGDLDTICPDWREREAFLCGPPQLLDALAEHWEREGDCERLHMERFQPIIGGDAGDGEGGRIRLLKSDVETEADGGTPILVAGEQAGVELPFGCRMGVCHTCIGKLCEGKLRDVRSGEVRDCAGEMVRTCIHAPEGDVVLDL